jgi:hypothetical protein
MFRPSFRGAVQNWPACVYGFRTARFGGFRNDNAGAISRKYHARIGRRSRRRSLAGW